MDKLIIDAEGCVMGRLASFAAKKALQGNEIIILNSEKAIISGDKLGVIDKYKKIRAMNDMKPRKGPFYSKDCDKIMKRSIRGMLHDFRLGRGREAFKKVKCYCGIPEEFKKEKLTKIEFNTPKKKMELKELKERL